MAKEVLSLYRAIMRLGRNQLRMTDQGYFRKLVAAEFRKNSEENNPQELSFHMKVSLLTFQPTAVVDYELVSP